ncbi:MAG: hypothetical protein R2752_09580 [Vicinamibacterales bacterium]
MLILAVVLATIASYALGWLLGVPVLVPLLNTAPAWWLMAREFRRGRVLHAVAAMLVWAATMAAASTTMSALGWSRTGDTDLFLRPDYRAEMIHWVRTGVGAESQPAVFVPRQVGTAIVFAGVALGTGGLAAMPMGAVLVNQMGNYVGAMAGASANPFPSVVLGWHPWAVIRVIAFVILGTLLSGVMIARWTGTPYRLATYRPWLWLAIALLVLDVILKVLLAPSWALLLRGLAGW